MSLMEDEIRSMFELIAIRKSLLYKTQDYCITSSKTKINKKDHMKLNDFWMFMNSTIHARRQPTEKIFFLFYCSHNTEKT